FPPVARLAVHGSNVRFTHDDRCGRRAEARDHALDPLRSEFGEPAAVLAALCAGQFTRMRPFGGTDGTEVPATGLTTINWAIQFDAQADKRLLRLDGGQHVELKAHGRTRHAVAFAAMFSGSKSGWERANGPAATLSGDAGRNVGLPVLLSLTVILAASPIDRTLSAGGTTVDIHRRIRRYSGREQLPAERQDRRMAGCDTTTCLAPVRSD